MTQSATPDLHVCVTAGGLALYFRLHFSYQIYLALKLPDHVTEFHHFSWFHLNMCWQPEPLCNKPLVIHEEMSVPWSHMRSRQELLFLEQVAIVQRKRGWGWTCKLQSSWTPTNHIFICHFVGPHLTQAQDNATSRIGGPTFMVNPWDSFFGDQKSCVFSKFSNCFPGQGEHDSWGCSLHLQPLI